MVTLIVLVILWTPCGVTKLLRAQHANTPIFAHPTLARAEPPVGAETRTGNQGAPVWSAVDDRQLHETSDRLCPRTATD